MAGSSANVWFIPCAAISQDTWLRGPNPGIPRDGCPFAPAYINSFLGRRVYFGGFTGCGQTKGAYNYLVAALIYPL